MKNTQTKTIILKKAAELFSQRGYFGVSMQDIADEVGITKAALYYHFESKDDLVEVLLRLCLNELKADLKQSVENSVLPSEAVYNITKTFLDFKLKHPEINLLVSLGVKSDENIPILATVSELRQELIRHTLLMVKGLEITKTATCQRLFSLSIVSIALSPFYITQAKTNRQSARDLSNLLVPSI